MSIARHHTEWLSLVPVSGPFLSLPVLMEAFNTGLEPHDPDQSRLLRQEYGNWEDSLEKRKADPAPHQHWIRFVLTKTLELDERVLVEGQAIPQTLQAEVPEHHELLRPSVVVIDPNTKTPRLLVQVYPRSQELTSYVANSRWKASPDTRMTELLHAAGVRLGLVTNGEHWMLVDAPKGETTGYASWYASLWLEEPITFRAFRSLLSASRFFNVPDDQTLEALLAKSASNQQEVTDQLGYQVRRAVEVLIHSLDRADQDFGRELLSDVSPEQLYESALTVMMRLVFLFCAEERELIPSKPFPVYEQNYSVSTISKQLRELADQHGEELLERRYDAWPRLLAAFRAVYGGLQHDDVHIPAYGGNLFNPDRFPFLEGRKRGTSWKDSEANPLPVNNRTVLHLLEALQLLQIKLPGGGPAEARRVSFRALDIEQIGHVYEGLLDHTAKRATEPFLGLTGTREKEPEIPLAELEKLFAKGEADLFKYLCEETGKQEKSLSKLFKAELESQDVARFRTACQSDDALWTRVKPLAGLVRADSFGYPVVIPKGSVFVTAGTDRRSSGTHYTPRSLTEPIVRYTLEPLVYVGPAEGKPKGEWKLKSAKELLELKICDMACGSGAFLVQTARYMAERLLEAWDESKKANPKTPGITPEGLASTGKTNEALIPDDPNERKTYAMRIIAQRCLYGVDKNPLAVEMAKLSLWLLTLAKDKPFEFLDHSIRCGDSLVGLKNIDQLKFFSLKPDQDDEAKFYGTWLEGVDEAINLRLKLEDMPANTVEDVQQQEKLLRDASDTIARLMCAADLLVAAEFWGENPKDKLERVRHAAVKSGYYVEKGPTEEFKQVAAKERRGQMMFHWPLEFPEVIVKRGGFDAFVGNPPFMHGSWISSNFGDNYASFVRLHEPPIAGKIDLVIYFLRRIVPLIRVYGGFGLILTSKACEGDARREGFQAIQNAGFSIYWGTSSLPWPGTASVLVCLAHGTRSDWHGAKLNSSLEPSEEELNVFELIENTESIYVGAWPGSLGFMLPVEQAERLLAVAQNNQVIRPFYTGADLAEMHTLRPSRYVIDFGSIPEADAASRFPAPFALIAETVKPDRLLSKKKIYRDRWWQFCEPQHSLFSAIRKFDEVLAVARVTKYFTFRFIDPSSVYSDKVIIYVRNSHSDYAILNSEMHNKWALFYGTTHGAGTPNYKPGVCGRAFPFPCRRQVEQSMLEALGRKLRKHVQACMENYSCGPTALYNLFHDTDCVFTEIRELRELHVAIDQAVAAAYGWIDMKLGHGFHETKQGVRFTISEPARREVLQRLLKLNHERYAEDAEQALRANKKAKITSKTKAATANASPTLFDDEDATFPSTERDNFLSGLVCELVKAKPGLPISAYVDTLVIALGYERHQRLLIGQERTQFAKLCKASPLAPWSASDRIPWSELKSLLTQRKAIDPKNQTILAGPELARVRKSYPTIAPELITLLCKAAAELRDLQSHATAQKTGASQKLSAEKAEMLKTFSQDQKQWSEVAV